MPIPSATPPTSQDKREMDSATDRHERAIATQQGKKAVAPPGQPGTPPATPPGTTPPQASGALPWGGGSGSDPNSGSGMNPFGSSPSSYNAGANLDSSMGMAQNAYGQAGDWLSKVGSSPPPSANITAQTVATPAAINAQTINAPAAINAQTIGADAITGPAALSAQTVGQSNLIAGPQADALRAQALQQAQDAANAPSSAAAQMRAAGTQIANQQLGQAAMARGADRAGAARAAMLGTGAQGMQAASTTSALAAQEQVAKNNAYSAALGNVRAGDVSAAQSQQAVGVANQQANLSAQAQSAQAQLAASQSNQSAALAAAQANQGTNLAAQTTTGAQALAAAEANQGANLTAQQATIQNQQAAWNSQMGAANAFMGTELQGVGAQNQGQAVASGYGQSQNNLNQTKGGALWSALGSMSDERAKVDVRPLPNIYGGHSVQSNVPNFLSANYQAAPLPQGAGAYNIDLNFTSPMSEKSPYGHVMNMLKGKGSPLGGDTKNLQEVDTVDAGEEDVEGSPVMGTEDVAGGEGVDAAEGIEGAEGAEGAEGIEGLDILSDEYCKNEVTPLGGGQSYSGLLQNAYGVNGGGSSPYGSEGTGHQDFLDWNWSPLDRQQSSSQPAAQQQQSSSSSIPGMGSMPSMSDERAKQQAEHMGQDEIAAWSEKVPTAVFRYKPGIPDTDGGADYHAGTLAQSLERTGPLGRLMVHQRPDGLKEVEYGPLGLMVGKGALTKADQALQLAQAAYALAADKKGSRHGRS